MNGWQIAAIVWTFLVAPGAVLIGRLLRARARTLDELEQQRYEQLQRWGRRP